MATKRDPRVQIAPAYAQTRRKLRHPQHKFSLQFRPYQFQPFMLAPVLPGETLQNLLIQGRFVSEPLKPALKLVGWWLECWFFYVKHRDLKEPLRTAMTTMMLDPAQNMDAYRSVAAQSYYHFDNGINFALECTKVIMEEYFRDEGENWNSFTEGGMPAVKMYGRGHNDPFDHLTLASNYRELGVAIPTGAEATVEDLDYAYAQWAAMKDAGLMDMDYQDFINSYGAETRQDEASPLLHRPELIRHMREWSYASNIVEPTTGVPSTAVTWSLGGRADKRMAFNEPGWVFGACTVRPKIFLINQRGSVAHGMDNVQNWLPPAIHGRSDVSHKNFAYSEGPLPDLFDDLSGAGGGNPQSYWIDIRDLLAYGDQFTNYAMDAVSGGVSLPTNTGQRRFPSGADIDAWFQGANKFFRADGVVSLGILGRQAPKLSQMVLGSGSLVP